MSGYNNYSGYNSSNSGYNYSSNSGYNYSSNSGYNYGHPSSGSAYQGSVSKYHGLVNQGSTCYLNSVLQVLFMTKDFREAVGRYSGDPKSLDFHLKELFKKLESSTTSTYKLNEVLGIKGGFVQSDAAECFENILSKVTNPAAKLFQGLLTTKNKCSKCGKETHTEDPFWSLPLELEDCYENYDVAAGIEKYFKESVLTEPNQLYCEHCCCKFDSTINVEINHHPEVLTLLLKRFKFNFDKMMHVKVKGSVQIPEILQIPPYGDKSQFYELYAFVEHLGELRSGHYVVTIKPHDEDRWYTFNDNTVYLDYYKPFRENSNEINPRAYLLFYRKIRESSKANDNGASTSGRSKSHQPCRKDRERQEGQRATIRTERGEVREEGHQNKKEVSHTEMTGNVDDSFKSMSDKPSEMNNDDSNMGIRNNQVVMDRTQVDHQHKQSQDLDRKQEAKGKHPPTGLHEGSAGSKPDTRERSTQTSRQEQDKVAAGAEGNAGKEEEVNHIGDTQERNKHREKQEENKEMVTQDLGSKPRLLNKYDLMKNTGSQPDQNSTDVSISNGQTQSRGEGDGEHPTSEVDQDQRTPFRNEKAERKDQQKTEMRITLNKPAEDIKPSHQRELKTLTDVQSDIQYFPLLGTLWERFDEINNYKNEKFLVLKERQETGGDFSKLNECHDPKCKINELGRHVHVPHRQTRERKRKMETGGTSENDSRGSELGQLTGKSSQPEQSSAAPPRSVKQNQLACSFHSDAANKFRVSGEDNEGCSLPDIHPSKGTTCSSLQGCDGAAAPPQQSCVAKRIRTFESLSSGMEGLSLNDSNNAGDQGGPVNETCTVKQPTREFDGRKKTNSQPDTRIQVEPEEADKDNKGVGCPGFLNW